MKIVFDEIGAEAVAESIIEKAKYQKVMLVYDNKTSQVVIDKIYRLIKDEVIFNKKNIAMLSQTEINDGYKVVVYCCSANSYLKLNVNNNECVNIFCPEDENILPFIIGGEFATKKDDVLFLQTKKLDVKMLCSIYFNIFYNHCQRLIFQQEQSKDFNLLNACINTQNLLNIVFSLDEDVCFEDIKILKQCGLLYEDIPIVQIVILNAIITLLLSIKEQNLMLVDVYKIGRQDDAVVDKLFSMCFDESFINIAKLNSQHLLAYANKTKLEILQLVEINNISKIWIEEVIEKLKVIAKLDKGMLGYLYLFNLFGV